MKIRARNQPRVPREISFDKKECHHLNMNEQTKMPKNALASTHTTIALISGAAATIARTKQIHSVKLFVFTLMNGPRVTKINTKHSLSTSHAKHLEKTPKHGAKKNKF